MRTLAKQSQDCNSAFGRHVPERSTQKKRGPVGPRPCWLSLEAVREAGMKAETVGDRHHESVALGQAVPVGRRGGQDCGYAPLRVVEAQADLQTHWQGISSPKAE